MNISISALFLSDRRIEMDIFAAIDLETTGLDFERCEVIELAIVPLNPDFTVSAIPEFTAHIKAEHPETAEADALRINGLNPQDGESKAKVRDDIIQWMKDNGIGRITPVAQIWVRHALLPGHFQIW